MPHEPLEDAFSSDESFDDEEGSESDSDVDAKLAEDDVFDVEFLKCYSALKKKDEKIYDENVRFFDDNESSSTSETDEKNEEGPSVSNIKRSKPPKMTLLDLQLRQSEETDDLDAMYQPKVDLNKEVSKSYYEKELEDIKKSIEKVNEDLDDSGDDLLVVKGSDGDSVETKNKNKIDSLLDRLVDQDGEDLNNLKEVWSNSENLSKEDKYLRDYILNKRYLPTNANVDDDGKKGFFSSNLDELSDVDESEEEPEVERGLPTRHSDEKDFDKLIRIPRNSTKTIRDMVEKREKREKRAKKLANEKKRKKAIGDAEDVIGDLPTRFHYRETEPNDFGLTAEELLMATDEELDRWVNLKECVAYKSQEEELAQKRKFDALRNNIQLKKQIFKSVYGDQSLTTEHQPQDDDQSQDAEMQADSKKSKKKRTRKRKRSEDCGEPTSVLDESDIKPQRDLDQERKDRKKKHRRRGLNHKKFAKVGVAPDRLLAYGLSKTKLKKNKLL